MNVNSIKINKVYHNGEVNLDEMLPEAVEGLEVVEGLIANENLLGAKNLLPLSLNSIKSLNTAGTWNDNIYSNSNGTIEVLTDTYGNVIGFNINGTFTGIVWFSLANFTLTQGKYILNGGAVSNIGIYGQGGTPFEGWNSTENIPEAQKEFNSAASGIMYLRVIAVEYNNVKVHPMIRLATDPNPTYRPYAMSNQELTSNVNTLNINKELFGVKNLLPLTLDNLKALNTAGTWKNNVYSFRELSFTVNTDDLGCVESITISGQPTSAFTFVLFQSVLNLPSTSKFKLGASGADVNFDCNVLNGNTSVGYIAGVSAPLKDVTLSDNTITRIQMFFNTSYNAEITIYPMIRLSTETNAAYQPYAMGNQELTQRLLSLESRVVALEG